MNNMYFNVDGLKPVTSNSSLSAFLIRNSYEFVGTVGISLSKNDLAKNANNSNLHQSNGSDDTLTQSIISSTIMMSSDF